MAKHALPNLGLIGGHAIGDDDWGDDQNLNLLKLSVLVQGGIIGRVAAPPDLPNQGDAYILTTDNTVQVYDDGKWTAYAPIEGWLLYDRGTDEYISFKPAGWKPIATGGGGDSPALPPLEGKAGQALIVNDEEDGVEWAPVAGGGGGGGTPDEAVFNYPDLTGFAWVNQRGATAVADKGGTAFSSPTFVNGLYTQKLMAAPAGDFDVYARVSALFNTSGDYPAWSISLRSSAAGRGLHLGATPANNIVYMQDVNDGGAFNGNRFNRGFNRMPRWYRLSRRGTIIHGYASMNGVDWNKVGQYDAGAMVIDQMGIGFIPSSVDNVLRVLHFSTVAPAFA